MVLMPINIHKPATVSIMEGASDTKSPFTPYIDFSEVGRMFEEHLGETWLMLDAIYVVFCRISLESSCPKNGLLVWTGQTQFRISWCVRHPDMSTNIQ